MSGLFRGAIEGPWCYLEFGDVGWCREPGRLDPRLREAGLRIAAQETGRATGMQALLHTGRLLREAHTNGAVFLALPANGPARNSINDQGSLLSAICRSTQATSCKGPSASEAEFRTGSGTWSRVSGLLLIAAGLLGMAMLLGYIALRLLMAAILSLFYLLLAPAVILAPAFGEAGRNIFRNWLVRLLGAVVSKLVLAFLLGVVLAVMAVLSGLDALGWWTQWLLLSAFWWGLFVKRHQLLAPAGVSGSPRIQVNRRSIARRAVDAVETRRRVAQRLRERRGDKHAPEIEESQPGTASEAASAGDRPALLRLGRDLPAQSRITDAPDPGSSADGAGARLERVERGQAGSPPDGESSRTSRLADRHAPVREDPGGHVQGRESPERANDGISPERVAFLNEQALLPAVGSGRSSRHRDYPSLAALAGYSHEEYERLDPKRRQEARQEIDRELAAHHERISTRPQVGAGSKEAHGPAPAPAEQAPSAEGRPPPRRGRPAGPRPAQESDVMRDARAVSEGRKKRLGFDRE